VLQRQLNEARESSVDDAFELKSRLFVSDATKMELEAGITEVVEVTGPRSHGESRS